MKVKTNDDKRLFVIPCNGGFSCIGYDVERFETARMYAELGWEPPTAKTGTLSAYEEHRCAVRAMLAIHKKTNRKFKSGLHHLLAGLEGKRISCTMHGETETFKVGKSMGWIPCHLMLKGSQWGEAIHARTAITNLRIIG